MTEVLEFLLALFIASQLIGFALGFIMAVIAIVYVTANALFDVYRPR